MTLYLDTSSLLKLYVEESGSEEVRQELAEAGVVATSAVSYAEARAAFERRRREGTISPAVFTVIRREFDADWSHLLIVEATEGLCRIAGELAEQYRLYGCDSIQLASCLHVSREDATAEVRFSSFDRQLNRAAVSALRRQRRSRV